MTWDSIQNSYDVSTKTTSWEDASAMDKVTDNLIDFVILLIIMCYLQTIPYRFRVAKSATSVTDGFRDSGFLTLPFHELYISS